MSRWTDFARASGKTQRASDAPTSAPESRLEVTVIFTTVSGTTAALDAVYRLASGFDLRLTLLVLQVVPYAVPLFRPPVSVDHLRRVALSLVTGACVNWPEIAIQILLCRDREECLRRTIHAGSVLFVGGRQSWWARSERRLARRLKSLGHEVIFVKAESVRQASGEMAEAPIAAWQADLGGEQQCSM